jgi:FAD/FMN-containing dehydrogenase
MCCCLGRRRTNGRASRSLRASTRSSRRRSCAARLLRMSPGSSRSHGGTASTRRRGAAACLAGFSSTRGIVIDVTPMNSIAVGDGVVRVGAGVRTGELCERLAEQGLAIPTGTCPSVGIAGLAPGGGLGILGRAYGLTLDHLLAAQVVLAEGASWTATSTATLISFGGCVGRGRVTSALSPRSPSGRGRRRG